MAHIVSESIDYCVCVVGEEGEREGENEKKGREGGERERERERERACMYMSCICAQFIVRVCTY